MATSSVSTSLLLVLVLVSCLRQSVSAENVYDLIQRTPQLSEFFSLISNDAWSKFLMQNQEATVFAPSNDALAKFQGNKDKYLLAYHIANLALTSDRLMRESSVVASLKGNQPLYVTVQRAGGGRGGADVYINDAKVIDGDLKADADGETQILHVIDTVLQPTIPSKKDSTLFNPSAMQLISNSGKYDMTGENTISKFYAKVRQFGSESSLFDASGPNTFFIPVDAAFQSVRDRFDAAVLKGHMIPGKALFMRTMGNDSYHTASHGDRLEVELRLHAGFKPQDQQLYYDVQSTTSMVDVKSSPGSVMSRVVRANIAVKNGVIHLIRKPLVVTNSDVFTLIKESDQGRAHEFFNLMKMHESFANIVMSAKSVTIFIPTNEAFNEAPQERLAEIKKDPTELSRLLNLHVSEHRVSSFSIANSTTGGAMTVSSSDAHRPLYVSVQMDAAGHSQMYVDGGGTNASVVVADLKASNGFVHFIDKILGIPYRNVGEKLAGNRLTSMTNRLAKQDVFFDKVNRDDKNYTMFVPSNAAWQKVQQKFPDKFNTLFGGKEPLQAADILDRHLIVGQSYSMHQLVELSEKDDGVNTFRSRFKLKRSDTAVSGFKLQWDTLEADVVRGDLECTNGYVHIIDTVMMRQRDVTTSAATYAVLSSAPLLLAALALLRL